ncbi:hypothetical protein BDV23DRAFT_43331 [Aspergillus alliaceus]|uniref:Uncharacterized protein n=1 Tax=Petromyces alliaceus TaxID=209559 RepID=A0A5N7BQQ3_PETAA|nr:hypothetical protein BDV23DRAFT_43331 [Aspergillus alliaceus]
MLLVFCPLTCLHYRESHDPLDTVVIGQEHSQAADAHTPAASRWQAVRTPETGRRSHRSVGPRRHPGPSGWPTSRIACADRKAVDTLAFSKC